jgi:hypothetical protein
MTISSAKSMISSCLGQIHALISLCPRLETTGATGPLPSRLRIPSKAEHWNRISISEAIRVREVARALDTRMPRTTRSRWTQNTDHVVIERVEGTILEDARPRRGRYGFIRLSQSYMLDGARHVVTENRSSSWLGLHLNYHQGRVWDVL